MTHRNASSIATMVRVLGALDESEAIRAARRAAADRALVDVAQSLARSHAALARVLLVPAPVRVLVRVTR